MNKKSFYITTPIYYVNDDPHIGHAYTTIAADVLARYHQLLGDDVFFLTGVDEHGQKVEQAAGKRGVSPQQHVDEYMVHFQTLWKRLNISNNDFVRTTEERHKKVVCVLLEQLHKKGDLYKDTYVGWYCLPDERYWTEKDLINGNCPDCGRSVSQLTESNWFFKMSGYQSRLIDYINDHPDFLLPSARRNEVLGFLQKPLADLCISRPKSRLSWGIPLPFDSDYVTYVWVDALVNYISIPDKKWWPATVHLVGKDILTTHAVYWSTMLMALDMPLPKTIFAHGWWTVDSEKMSKSRGNVVDPTAMVNEFGLDPFRYFLLREVPFGQDGNFSHESLLLRYNSDLANDLGNLVSRTASLIEQLAGGHVPEPSTFGSHPQEEEVKAIALNLHNTVAEAMNQFEFHLALGAIWNLVNRSNRYIEEMAPWKLAKNPANAELLKTFLYTAVSAVRHIACFLSPFMPETSDAIRKKIGMEEVLCLPIAWGGVAGNVVIKGDPLFPRREKKKEAVPLVSVILPSSLPTPDAKSLVTIEDFGKLDLRVGIIKQAERIPKSTKLLKLQVDTGKEVRQVVAGIAEKYEPTALIGKKIIVVCNLVPVKLKGVVSEGMLLAAGSEAVFDLATFLEDVPAGTKIK
jgi:methionyl-tRNA synthetase